jgi:alkylation response protein AidB-like acyl-CoA dehydrogenase
MDFQPSSEQRALVEGIERFCAERLPHDGLQAQAADPSAAAEVWQWVAELGVLGLRADEGAGGLGLGLADAVLVFEVLGRHLVPGPLVWTEIAAPLFPETVTGTVRVGGLDQLDGLQGPLLVEHAADLDQLIVLSEAGVDAYLPGEFEGLAIERNLDPLTPLRHVERLTGGERIAGPDVALRLRDEGMVLTAALQLGLAEAALEIALAFAKTREQFDRTIGSFQSIKHIFADMFARQELARAAVYAAGATYDHPEVGDVAVSARAAKIVAGEAAMKNARACIQIHGGMGYTWEMPDHFFLKRAWVLDNSFGTPEEHALDLGTRVGVRVGEEAAADAH